MTFRNLIYPVFILLALLTPYIRRKRQERQRQAWRAARVEKARQRAEEPADEGRVQKNGTPPDDLDEI